MKRLIIAAAVFITFTGMSAWAQAPAADADKAPQPAPAQRVMPMELSEPWWGNGRCEKRLPDGAKRHEIRAGRNAHASNDAWDDARQHASG